MRVHECASHAQATGSESAATASRHVREQASYCAQLVWYGHVEQSSQVPIATMPVVRGLSKLVRGSRSTRTPRQTHARRPLVPAIQSGTTKPKHADASTSLTQRAQPQRVEMRCELSFERAVRRTLWRWQPRVSARQELASAPMHAPVWHAPHVSTSSWPPAQPRQHKFEPSAHRMQQWWPSGPQRRQLSSICAKRDEVASHMNA